MEGQEDKKLTWEEARVLQGEHGEKGRMSGAQGAEFGIMGRVGGSLGGASGGENSKKINHSRLTSNFTITQKHEVVQAVLASQADKTFTDWNTLISKFPFFSVIPTSGKERDNLIQNIKNWVKAKEKISTAITLNPGYCKGKRQINLWSFAPPQEWKGPRIILMD